MRGWKLGGMSDPLLRALVTMMDHDPERLQRRLLDDAALRSRYISPLIRLWCTETVRECANPE